MIRSRVVFATIEAAAIDRLNASPLMIDRAASRRVLGIKLPSISANSAAWGSASNARIMARCDAWRILIWSISSTVAMPTPISAHFKRRAVSSFRRNDVSRLESSNPAGISFSFQYDSCRHDRASKRAPSCLIHAGNARIAFFTGNTLCFEIGCRSSHIQERWHSFGSCKLMGLPFGPGKTPGPGPMWSDGYRFQRRVSSIVQPAL